MSSSKSIIIVNYKFECYFAPLIQAFRSLGFSVLVNRWNKEQLKSIDLNQVLFYMVDFQEAIRYVFKSYKMKRFLSKYNIPLIANDRDTPYSWDKLKFIKKWRTYFFNLNTLFDIYITHSEQSLNQFGKQSLYSANGVNLTDYNLKQKTLKDLKNHESYQYDVSFFGNYNAKFEDYQFRNDFIQTLEQRLKQEYPQLRFKWIDTYLTQLSIQQQIDLIQTSKVNLQVGASCDFGKEKSWGLPERCFGIPACGGLLLSDNRKHLHDHYVINEDILMFDDSVDDCLQKILWVYDHFEESRQMAERAYQKTIEQNTYVHRAKEIILTAKSYINQ